MRLFKYQPIKTLLRNIFLYNPPCEVSLCNVRPQSSFEICICCSNTLRSNFVISFNVNVCFFLCNFEWHYCCKGLFIVTVLFKLLFQNCLFPITPFEVFLEKQFFFVFLVRHLQIFFYFLNAKKFHQTAVLYIYF